MQVPSKPALKIYLRVASLSDFVGHWTHIQDGPEKNGTAYFPQYVDAITGISVFMRLTSPEENYTKITNFGLFSGAHFVRQCQDPKFSLFSSN